MLMLTWQAAQQCILAGAELQPGLFCRPPVSRIQGRLPANHRQNQGLQTCRMRDTVYQRATAAAGNNPLRQTAPHATGDDRH